MKICIADQEHFFMPGSWNIVFLNGNKTLNKQCGRFFRSSDLEKNGFCKKWRGGEIK